MNVDTFNVLNTSRWEVGICGSWLKIPSWIKDNQSNVCGWGLWSFVPPSFFFFEIEIWPFLTHLHFDVHPRCFKRSTRSPAWECGDCSIHHQSAGSRGFMIFHHQKHTFSNLDDMIGKHLTWGNHTWFGSPNSRLSPALSVWTNAEKRWICSRHHI